MLQQWGLSRNPTLEQARAEVHRTHGKLIQSGLYPNPTIGYSASEVGNGVGALAVAARDPDSGREVALCVTYPTALLTAVERTQALQLLEQARRQLQSPHAPLSAPLSSSAPATP